MKRALFLAAALALSAASHAQQTVLQFATAPVLDVQRLAPQLVAFAGGDVNFANLVNGLALGVPVTLTTAVAPGVTQVASFTPAGRMSPTQIAQTLEVARQSLIARGIVAPTAEQVGASLVGGSVVTPTGVIPASALIATTTALTTNNVPTTASSATAMSPAAAIQSQRGLAAAGGTVRNTSDSPFPRGISDTPVRPVPGVTTTPASSTTGTSPIAPAPGLITVAPVAPATAPAAPRLGAR